MASFDIAQLIQTLSIWALPVLIAITLHEAAHGYAALRYGDSTAWMLGRVTLNPIKHIDPIGTVAIPLVLVLLGSPYLFGYAKPVPVNFMRLKPRRLATGIVAAAGPMANLILALLSVVFIYIAILLPPYFAEPMVLMGVASIQINILLMCLNLLPILPLDGGRVLGAIIPPRWDAKWSRLEPYGMIVLLVLLFSGVLFPLIKPFVEGILSLIGSLLPNT